MSFLDFDKKLPHEPAYVTTSSLADSLCAGPSFSVSPAHSQLHLSQSSQSSDHSLQTCSVSEPIKLAGAYVYPVRVVSSSTQPYLVWRRWEEFVALNDKLLASPPRSEAASASRTTRGRRGSNATTASVVHIPRLPRRIVLFLTRSVAFSRRDDLDLFVRRLFDLPEEISQCAAIIEFFSMWPRDIVNQHKSLFASKDTISTPLETALPDSAVFGAFGRPSLAQKRSTPNLRQAATNSARSSTSASSSSTDPLSPPRPSLAANRRETDPEQPEMPSASGPKKLAIHARYRYAVNNEPPSPSPLSSSRKVRRTSGLSATDDDSLTARGVSPLSFRTDDSCGTIIPAHATAASAFTQAAEDCEMFDSTASDPVSNAGHLALRSFRSLQDVRKAGAAPNWAELPLPPLPTISKRRSSRKLGIRSRSGSVTSAAGESISIIATAPLAFAEPPCTPTRALIPRPSMADLRARKISTKSTRAPFKTHSPSSSISSTTSSFDTTGSSAPSLEYNHSVESASSGRMSIDSADSSLASPAPFGMSPGYPVTPESPPTPYSDIASPSKYYVDPQTGVMTCNNKVPPPPLFPLPPSMQLRRAGRSRSNSAASGHLLECIPAGPEYQEDEFNQDTIVPYRTFALKVLNSSCNVMMRIPRSITLADALDRASKKVMEASCGNAGQGPWKFSEWETEEQWREAVDGFGEKARVRLVECSSTSS